jgi:hypothetical protein
MFGPLAIKQFLTLQIAGRALFHDSFYAMAERNASSRRLTT